MALPRTLLQRWLEDQHACDAARRHIGNRTPIEVVTRTLPTGEYEDVDGFVRWTLQRAIPDPSCRRLLRNDAIQTALVHQLRTLHWRDAARLLPEPLYTIEKKMRQNRGERWGRY